MSDYPPGARPVEGLASVSIPIIDNGRPVTGAELRANIGQAAIDVGAIRIGWQVYEVCPFEHQGDPERRGGVVVGMSDTHAVVVRFRRRGKVTEPREQAIPIDNLDPERVLPPDRRECHRTARMILAAVGAGRGDVDDDDRKWISCARQLAEVR